MAQVQILKQPQVSACSGIPRSTLYLKIARGEFPKPIKLGTRAVGWLASDVDAWVAERIKASRTPAQGGEV